MVKNLKKIMICALPGEITSNGIKTEYCPTLSIYLLAAILRERRYDVKILDPSNFQGDCKTNIKDAIREVLVKNLIDIDIIAFSSNTFSWSLTKIAVEIIREFLKDITIIAGGLHPTVFYEHILRTCDIDYILRGEGEVSLPLLIEAIEKESGFEDVPGIAFIDKDGFIFQHGLAPILSVEEMSNQPLPDFSEIPSGVYHAIPVEASRGCYYCCAFCSIPHRHNWRPVSIDIIMKRIKYAKQFASRFNNTYIFNFVDDCFTSDPIRVKRIFNELQSLEDGFKYFIEARINDFIREDCFSTLNRDMIHGIQFGVECGYDEGLKKIMKGTSIKNLYKCAEQVNKNNLNRYAVFSFILGFPWESQEDMCKTLDTIYDLSVKYDIKTSLNWLILLPSRIWDERKKYGINIKEDFFDRTGWFTSETAFYTTHPSVTPKIFDQIERKIYQIISYGYDLIYTPPDFMLTIRENEMGVM